MFSNNHCYVKCKFYSYCYFLYAIITFYKIWNEQFTNFLTNQKGACVKKLFNSKYTKLFRSSEIPGKAFSDVFEFPSSAAVLK